MLNIRELSFKYKNNREFAIKDISFSANNGQCIVLTGVSGCGKSTVLKSLNGLIPRMFEGEISGEIVLNNRDIKNLDFSEICKEVGSVLQDPRGQFFTTDTLSEMAFAMENFAYPKEEIIKRIEEISKALETKNLLGKNIFNLSSGERQKVSLACALMLKPKVLIFDEPSSNLDYSSVIRLRDRIMELKKQGHIVIVAEHRMFYLKDIYDKLILLDKGEIIEKIEKTKEKINSKKVNLRAVNIFDNKYENTYENKDIEENYGEVESINYSNILKNINFKIKRGDILAIIGKNGVGKTTLANIICGFIKPDSGKVNLKERPFFVMQDSDYQLFSESVVSELKIGRKDIELEEINRALEKVALINNKEKHPFELSGGEKQRLITGASYLSNRSIIIYDEPTSGLDADNMKRTAELIKEFSKNKAVIIISHDYEFIVKICNRAIFLDDGEVKEDINFTEGSEDKLLNIFEKMGGIIWIIKQRIMFL